MASKKKLKLVEKQEESKVAEFNQKEREHIEPAEWQLFMELKQEAEAAAAIMNVQQKRLVKKYGLGQFDGVDMYGNIERNISAPASPSTAAPVETAAEAPGSETSSGE